MKTIDVYFDIDGCLINRQYSANLDNKKIKDIVTNAKNKGLTFNLNSNRSINSILNIRNEFLFNGKIIYENGIGLYDPDKNKKQKTEFKKIDKVNLENFLKLNKYDVIFLDTDIIVKDLDSVKKYSYDNTNFVFCEISREYTMTLYPRDLTSNEVSIGDVPKLKEIIEQEYKDYKVNDNYFYNNIIMVPRNSNKGSLLKKISKNNIIASFGDEEADISMFKQSQFIGCPSNADEIVKEFVFEQKGFISKEKYTRGAMNYINYLLEKI